MQRNVLVSFGCNAHAVSQMVYTKSQRWIALSPPPIRCICVYSSIQQEQPTSAHKKYIAEIEPTSGSDCNSDIGNESGQYQQPSGLQPLSLGNGVAHTLTLTEAESALCCAFEELASQAFIEQIDAAGYCPIPNNEMNLWFVLDISALGKIHNDQSVIHEDNGLYLLEPVAESLDAVLRLVEYGIQSFFERFKIHLTPKVLMLCRPDEQGIGADWAKKLRPIFHHEIYVASSINAADVGVNQWLERAACALAACLWRVSTEMALSNQYLPQTHIDGLQVNEWVRAIGGSSWVAPKTALMRWLNLDNMHGELRQLLGKSEVASSEQNHHSTTDTTSYLLSIPSMAQLFHELGRETSLTTTEIRAVRRYPKLSQLSQLSVNLPASVRRALGQRNRSQAEARNRWLRTTQSRWAKQLEELRLSFVKSWQQGSSLWRYQAELDQVICQLKDAAVQTNQALADIEADLKRQDAHVFRTVGKLAECCAIYPALEIGALMNAAAQPWLWVSWFNTYFGRLPAESAAVVNSIVRYEQMIWRRDNLQTLQQAYALMKEAVSTLTEEAASMEKSLDFMIQLLVEKQATLLDTHLSDFSATQLHQLTLLWNGSSNHSPSRNSLNTHIPFDEWPTWEPEELVEQLIALCLADMNELAHFSPLEILLATQPNDKQLQQRVEQMIADALPLWPAQELLAELEETSLLLSSEAEALNALQAADDFSTQGSRTLLTSSTQSHLEDGCLPADPTNLGRIILLSNSESLTWAESSIDGLLCLRWWPVDLAEPI